MCASTTVIDLIFTCSSKLKTREKLKIKPEQGYVVHETDGLAVLYIKSMDACHTGPVSVAQWAKPSAVK